MLPSYGPYWLTQAHSQSVLQRLPLYDQGSFGDVETLLPTMILQFMPPWIAGLLLAGVLAAIISTANSQLVVVTGSVTEDIINQALGIKLTEKQLLWLSRFSVLFFGAIGGSLHSYLNHCFTSLLVGRGLVSVVLCHRRLSWPSSGKDIPVLA